MNIEIHINGHLVHTMPVTYECIQEVADGLRDFYRVDLLNNVGVKTEIFVSGVGSLMNHDFFMAKPEWYDGIIEGTRRHAI